MIQFHFLGVKKLKKKMKLFKKNLPKIRKYIVKYNKNYITQLKSNHKNKIVPQINIKNTVNLPSLKEEINLQESINKVEPIVHFDMKDIKKTILDNKVCYLYNI